jgi:Rrf2 family protein
MKLSTRARYALRMMVELADHQRRRRDLISLADISRRTNISRRYLEQLAISLKHGALVTGTAGKGGGYTLTRRAADVSMAEIIESAIGPINIVSCVLQPGTCRISDDCECRWVYETVNRRIVEALRGISLDELTRLRSRSATLEIKDGDRTGCPLSPK